MTAMNTHPCLPAPNFQELPIVIHTQQLSKLLPYDTAQAKEFLGLLEVLENWNPPGLDMNRKRWLFEVASQLPPCRADAALVVGLLDHFVSRRESFRMLAGPRGS